MIVPNIHRMFIRVFSVVLDLLKKHTNNQVLHINDKAYRTLCHAIANSFSVCCEDFNYLIKHNGVEFSSKFIIDRNVNTRKANLTIVCPYCDEVQYSFEGEQTSYLGGK